MNLQIDFWELLLAIAGVAGAVATVIWSFSRVIVGQFDRNLGERFESLNELRNESNRAIERRFDALENNFEQKHTENKADWDRRFRVVEDHSHQNEKAMLKLRAELPNDYVRREDWIRFSGTIDSKLDTLRTMLDAMKERWNARG